MADTADDDERPEVHLARIAGAGDAPVVEALLDGVVVADETGHIAYANRAVERILGWSPAMLQGQPVALLVPARFRSAHEAGFANFAAGGPSRLMGHPIRVPALTAGGTEAPIELVLSNLPRGSRVLVVATIRDASERVDLERHSHVVERLLALLAEEDADVSSRLLEVVGSALEYDTAALWLVDADGRHLRARDFWARNGRDVAGFRAATAAGVVPLGVGLPGRVLASQSPMWIADLEVDANFPRAEAALASSLRSGFAFPILAGGRTVGVIELFAGQRRAPDRALLAAMGVVGERLGGILARLDAERERERLLAVQEFLLGAARVLAEAADYAEALDRLAAVAVPALGDLCLIDVLADDGTLTRMAARHADPTKQSVVDELHDRYPPDPNGSHPSVEAIRTRRSQWGADLSEEFLRTTTRDARHLELVRALGVTAYICVPLVAVDRVLGTLTLVVAGSGRRFAGGDLSLAEELARHAATLIDRARRHDRDRTAAHELQRSLLPDRLPELPGLALAARYLPGTEGADVGGDWYDVMRLRSGAVALVIGDVAGHDMGAAGEMGQLRHALRAYAVDREDPASLLSALRTFAEAVGLERIATVAVAVLDPRTGELGAASAGHFLPVIRRADGRIEVAAADAAPPLGAPGGACVTGRSHLERGEAVVLFTDGLVEVRGANLADGLARLAEALAEPLGGDPGAACDALVERMLRGRDRNDDIAVLLARRA
ncbi:MAG TPA: SpoIIE family protein phosphatase [Acidimicrobiales bacterium]|nr:SpoIIE family protein phosphatase [Acidimicrobiales bacterium]